MDRFIKELKKSEGHSIIEVMAFMSYNPSIGRVLKAGGVKKFQEMAVQKVKKLGYIRSIREFDSFHGRWIIEFMSSIRTNKDRKCSYGQAQKAINVFLKLFVDWSGLPDSKTAKRLLPFLHVPLDSVLMGEIKKKYCEFFNKEIRPLQRANGFFSLSKIDEKEYLKWQSFFREKHPKKPLLFDIVWAINR